MNTDVHSLVGAYALDAVDDLERAAFERHMDECGSCRAEIVELREAAARLADGAWSVPPPALRDTVLAEIANTRQLPPAGRAAPPVSGGRSRRVQTIAVAAAVLVGAVGSGITVYGVQESRVRHERVSAEAARTNEARVRTIMAAPDMTIRSQQLNSGGRVTVASSRIANAGVIMLAATGAPTSGKVYQLWTVRGSTPSSAGALGHGQSAIVKIVEGLPGASGVGVTLEPAPGSEVPTTPVDALVPLT